MRNNLRNLLSVPALAIAAMAVTTAGANAQCPGGCFWYPTPSQLTVRSYAPAVQYQQVQVVPVQTFVQPQVFVAPEFIPTQTFAQPQPIIAPPEFAPAPVQQTFVSQPAIVDSGITSVPQNFPQPAYSGLPAGAYNVHPVLPGQSGLPVQQPVAGDAGAYGIPPVTKPMNESSADDMDEDVQEGQIEGEIISPADEASGGSVMEDSNNGDVPLTAPGLAAEEAEKAEMEKAKMEKAAMEKAEMEKAAMLEKAAMEKAEMEKAAMLEKAAMEKAEMEKAAMLEKAAMDQEKANMEAAKRKAAMERAAERKAAKKKSDEKVLTKEERIANLENSRTRQIKRAEQVNKRNLKSKLEELKADNASEAMLETAKLESAAALKAKLAQIEKRIQARIDQLKN